jgi:hypothetical protein
MNIIIQVHKVMMPKITDLSANPNPLKMLSVILVVGITVRIKNFDPICKYSGKNSTGRNNPKRNLNF